MKAVVLLLALLGPASAFVVPRYAGPVASVSFRSRLLSPGAAAEGAMEGALDPKEESPPVTAVAEDPAPVVKEPEPAPEPAPVPVVVPKAKSAAIPFLPAPPPNDYVGNVGFDPLRLSEIGFPIEWLREAEVKHGRICMLATLGFIATDCGLRFPGEQWQTLKATSVQAHDVGVQSGLMTVLLTATGFFELFSALAIGEMMRGSDRKPGDFGFDPLQFQKGMDPAKMEAMELKEITHCRLAMLGFSGIVTQAALGAEQFPYLSFN